MPVNRLYVLYDPGCGLCTRIKTWLVHQPVYIPMLLIAAGSETAKRLFPSLPQSGESGELTVISDNGGVYFSDHAWLMCLYALREYRGLSKRMASPALQPLVRQAIALISQHRYSISRLLGLTPEPELRAQLNGVPAPRCVR
jgi:predicted DCC family thiol-disulfide oxidoreductase YuxK